MRFGMMGGMAPPICAAVDRSQNAAHLYHTYKFPKPV